MAEESADTADTVARLTAENEHLRAERAKDRETIDHLQVTIGEQQRELRAAWDRLGAAETDRRAVQAELAQLRAHLGYRLARRARNAVRRKQP